MSTAQLLMGGAVLLMASGLAELAVLWAQRPPRAETRSRRAVRGARWSRGPAADARVAALLDAAGPGGPRSPEEFVARQRSAMVVGATWGAAAGWTVGGLLGAPLAAGLGAIAGRGTPWVLTRRVARRRAQELAADAPELLALLAVAAGCGLPIPQTLTAASDWLTGELAEACGLAARDLQRGAAIDGVLARLVREHPIDEVSAAVAVLQRARAHGTAPAPALRAQAAAARERRAREAADAAARAAPRIQLVAALLLVPAALCMLAAAMVSGGLN